MDDTLPPEGFCHVQDGDNLGRLKGCGSEPGYKVTVPETEGVSSTFYACRRHLIWYMQEREPGETIVVHILSKETSNVRSVLFSASA